MKLCKNETIRKIRGYEEYYAVTSLGRIWSYRRKRFLKPGLVGHGYLSVVLSMKGKQVSHKVHRLVGEAFVDNRDNKPQINHKNGDKIDCRACNLEWVTARENMQHASDLKLNKTYKLSYEDKVLICQLSSINKLKQVKLARMFGVTPPSINYVIRTYTPIIATNHHL
jgi:hypothetical protein